MRRLLLLLALLCCGCAALPTAQASGDPPSAIQYLTPVATFDDGTRVAMFLSQVGPEVYGSALYSRGSTRLGMNAVGLLHDGQLSVRLTPDSRTTRLRTLIVTGQLEGSGSWTDRATNVSGRLTLSGGETVDQRADGITVTDTLQFVASNDDYYLTLDCQITRRVRRGVYSGSWVSNTALGQPISAGGSFSLKVSDGQALMQLSPGAGSLSFPLPSATNSTALDPDSDLLANLPGQGEAVLADIAATVTLNQ